jgi:hypothetical protein
MSRPQVEQPLAALTPDVGAIPPIRQIATIVID